MSALLQVIGREMRVRALMPATGAATAVTILLAGWLVAGGSRFKDVAESSIYFAAFFLAAGGLLMGALLIGRDLEGGRSLFWLARPVGAWTVYLGKLVAAFVLVVVTTLLVAAPAIVVDPGLLEEPLVFSGGAVFAIACIALGASLGLLIGNRSAWFLPVAAILVGFGAGFWVNLESFFWAGFGIIELFLWVAVGSVIVALVAAHGLAFVHGRYDARAQSRQFTFVLLVILGSVLAASVAFGSWLRSRDLSDFSAYLMRAGAGDQVVVDGYMKSPIEWSRTFVLDVGSGTSVALAPGSWDVAISPRRIFYAVPTSLGKTSHEIFTIEPGADMPRRRTGITSSGRSNRMTTPSDGSRLAISTSQGTQVYDLAGESMGSFGAAFQKRGATGGILPLFVDRDRLRLYETSEGVTLIREADLRTRTIRNLGTIGGRDFLLTASLDRVVVRSFPEPRVPGSKLKLSLHDATTGTKIFDFPAKSRWAAALADRTWAVVMGDGDRLLRVGVAGEVLSEIRLGHRTTFILGEIRPGIVGVMTAKSSTDNVGPRSQRTLILVDMASGRVVKTIPEVTYWPRFSDLVLPEAGSPEARLIVYKDELHLIDPETLEPKKLELR